MTILFLTRLFYPHVGGVEKHVWEVGKRLAAKGHRVIVVTEELENRKKDEWQSLQKSAKKARGNEFGSVMRFSAGSEDRFKKFRIWRWFWENRALLQSADIIHCHDVFFWYLPFRFLYPQKKVYTTFHGYETKFPPSKKAILVRKLSELLSRGNICVGDYIKKWYGTNPDYVIYGAVEVGESKKLKVKSKKNKNKTSIIFLGRFDPDTGVKIYLKALEVLRKRNIDFVFQAYGDGLYKEEMAAYGEVSFVRFDEKPAQLHAADFIFASSYLSMVEAFAMRKFVIAAFGNPLKYDYLAMSPFAKWITVEGSAQGVADAVEFYHEHPDQKEKMIDEAYQWVKKQSWDNVTDIYLKLWNV